MTYEEIAEVIDDFGLSFAYYSFPESEAPSLPYVVYYYPGIDDVFADNSNYCRIERLIIELYTENKDFATEATVESTLKSNGISYDKTETWIESEAMYQITYESEVVING